MSLKLALKRAINFNTHQYKPSILSHSRVYTVRLIFISYIMWFESSLLLTHTTTFFLSVFTIYIELSL